MHDRLRGAGPALRDPRFGGDLAGKRQVVPNRDESVPSSGRNETLVSRMGDGAAVR